MIGIGFSDCMYGLVSVVVFFLLARSFILDLCTVINSMNDF